MKLTLVACPYFKNAKKIIAWERYLFVLTGRAIVILTRELEYVKTIEGVKYAYEGSISPDEKNLLVTSNDSEFYIISLETLEMVVRCKLKGKVVGVEGRGCWSPDGKSVLLLIMNKETYKYSLRTYPIDNLENFRDDLTEMNYSLVGIVSIPTMDSVYVFAQNRSHEWTNGEENSLSLLQIKNGETIIKDIKGQRDWPVRVEYLPQKQRFVAYTASGAFICDLNGENVKRVDLGVEFTPGVFSTPLIVKHIVESKNGKYLYMASTFGLEIFDAKTGDSLYAKALVFGAENIFELSESMIVVGLYSGSSKLYKIQV